MRPVKSDKGPEELDLPHNAAPTRCPPAAGSFDKLARARGAQPARQAPHGHHARARAHLLRGASAAHARLVRQRHPRLRHSRVGRGTPWRTSSSWRISVLCSWRRVCSILYAYAYAYLYSVFARNYKRVPKCVKLRREPCMRNCKNETLRAPTGVQCAFQTLITQRD